MPIVSITMIIKINKLLQEKGLPYKIHLSDACGRQSMWIEMPDDDKSLEQSAEFYKTIEDYFSKHRMQLKYSPDRHTFWVAG